MALLVNDNTPRAQYTATASQTVFAYPFAIFVEADLKVYQTLSGVDADDTADILVLTTDYTISGEGTTAGGNVTLVSGAAAGDIITIERDLAMERTSDYQTLGDFASTALNDDLDKLVMMAQQNESSLERTFKVRSSDSSITDFDYPAPESGKYIRFNGAGTGLEAGGLPIALTGDVTAFDTMAAMQGISSATDGDLAQLYGYYARGDGGGGNFYWNSSSTASDNGGTIIKATAIATGRWIRLYSGAFNARWFGVTGDGTTDDRVAIALMVAALPSSGGILFFPKGIYYTNSTSPVLTVTDISSVTVQGEGQTATSFRQGGTGDGIHILGTTEVVNTKLKDFEVRGAAGIGQGVYMQNTKDGDIESVDVYNFKGHAIEIGGGSSLNNTIRRCRLGSALNASSERALIKVSGGNSFKAQDNYLNGVGNPNDGGTGAKYGIHLDGTNGVTLISNIYDGLQYAVKTNSVTVAINEYLDFSSSAPYKLDNGYWITASNSLTIVGNSRSETIETIIYNPSNAISDKYINLIGHNDGEHGGSISGTLIAASVAPSQITSDQNDYDPSNGRYSLHWRINSDAVRTITGIGSRSNGHCLILTNSGSFPITLARNSTSSASANRILTGKSVADYVLGIDTSVMLIYETTSNKWRIIGPQRKTVTSGITANTDSIQGSSTTFDVIEISVCANVGDAVTLIPAIEGIEQIIINNGANSADIFPASGDSIDGGSTNAAVALAAGSKARYIAIDSTSWYIV